MLFDFLSRRRRAPKVSASRRPRFVGGRTRLRHPERLETRLPFAAPQIGSLFNMLVEVDQVEVSGFINDEHPESVGIAISGATSGSASVDQYGYFYYRGHLDSLGEITVVATDGENLTATGSVSVYNSSPYLNYAYAYATGNGKDVYVSGSISDDFLEGNVVHLGGVVSGTAEVDVNGYFQGVFTASGLGEITAYATDYWGATSNSNSSSIYADAPSFSVSAYESGPNREVTLSGSVYSGLYGAVTSATAVGVVAGSAGIDSSGQFSITQQATGQGTVQVQITNVWGLSTTESVSIYSQPAQVSGLSASYIGNGEYQITGWVSDEFAPGLTVKLGGVLGSGSAVVDASGAFSVTIAGAPGLQGNITASVTDWWGLESSQEFASLI
jgi:hypothetical protein